MMPHMERVIGALGGIVFGILIAYSIIGPVGAGIVGAGLLLGLFIPNPLREFFGPAIIGILIGFGISGGTAML